MKALALIALCLFVGVSLTSCRDAGEGEKEQYVFNLKADSVVIIPMKGRTPGQAVKVEQTVRITRKSQRTYILQAEDIVIHQLRKHTHNTTSDEQMVQLSEDSLRLLTNPIEVVVTNQKITGFLVEAGTPRWARNIFRGLLTTLHFVFEQSGDLPVGGTSRASGPENEFQVPNQESLFGKCHTEYQQFNLGSVSSSKDQIIQKLKQVLNKVYLQSSGQHDPRDVENVENRFSQLVNNLDRSQVDKFCDHGDNLMVVTKGLDLSRCQNIATLAMGHPAVELNNTKPLYRRIVGIVHLGCGMGPGDFKTLGVQAADTLNVGFPHSDIPSMVQVTTQVAQLKEITQGHVKGLVTPVPVNGIQYEFPKRFQESGTPGIHNQDSDEDETEHSSGDERGSTNEEFDESLGNLETPGVYPLILDRSNGKGYSSTLRELLREITKQFRESTPSSSSVNVHKVMDNYRTVVKIVRLLSKQELKDLGTNIAIEGQSSNNRGLWTLYFNALLIAGTQPSLACVDQYVRQNNIDTRQKLHYLLLFPQYVRRPTKQLIRMFKATTERLIESQSDPQILKSTAQLSLASITYQACVNTRIARAKYPLELHGELCNPSFARNEVFQLLGRRMWPGYMAQGDDEQKAVLITAVSLLGLPESVELFEQVIQDLRHSTYIRTKALFGYKRLIYSENGNAAISKQFIQKIVLPNLLEHATNEENSRPVTVEMAAASLLLVCEHSDIHLWNEVMEADLQSRNSELRNFAASSLHSIASMKKPVSQNHKRMKDLAAQVLSRLGNPELPENSPTPVSINVFEADETNEEAELEFYQRFALLKSVYFKKTDYLHLYTKGTYGLGPHPLPVVPLEIHLSLQSAVSQIVQKSKLYAQLSVWDSVFLSAELNSRTLKTLLKNTVGSRILAIWYSESENNAIRDEIEHINVENAAQAIDISKEVPNILGYPVIFDSSTPLILSTVGSVGIKGQSGNTRVQGDFRFALASQFRTHLGIKVTPIGKELQVGSEKNLFLQVPLRIVVQKRAEREITVAVSPQFDLESRGQGEITLASILQSPFVAVVKHPLISSLKEKYESFEFIRTAQPIAKTSRQLGEETLGFKLQLEEDKDAPSTNLRNNHISYVNQTLKLKVGESQTRTVVVVLAAGEAGYLKTQKDNSGSNSDENEDENRRGLYVLGAVVGKNTAIRPLGRFVSDLKEITGQNQSVSSTFQYLIESGVDKENVRDMWFRISSGNAANKVAQTSLAKVEGYEAMQEVLGQIQNNGQESRCVEVHHDTQQGENNFNHRNWLAKTQIGSGKDCSNLKELELDTLIHSTVQKVIAHVQTNAHLN